MPTEVWKVLPSAVQYLERLLIEVKYTEYCLWLIQVKIIKLSLQFLCYNTSRKEKNYFVLGNFYKFALETLPQGLFYPTV